MRKHSIRFTIPMLILTLLLSACGATTNVGSGTSTPTSTPSPTEASLLRRSITAMQAIATTHFAINEVDKNMFPPSAIKVANTSDVPATVSANLASMLQNISPIASLGGGRAILTTTISGDQITPDQSQEHVDVQLDQPSAGGSFNPFPIRILKNDKLYLLSLAGRWWVINKKYIPSSQGLAKYIDNSINQVTVQTKLALQLGQVNDRGTEIIQGKQLRHLSVIAGMSALPAMLANGYLAIGGYISSQDDIKNMILNLDFWIDPGNAYLYKQSMDLRYRFSPTFSNTPLNFASEVTRTTELSKFNQAVTITPPENATVTTVTDLNLLLR